MKLITKFWLLLMSTVILGITVNVVSYFVLNSAHEEQLVKEAKERLSVLIDQHANHFVQEMVNEMFFAVKLRSERMVEQYADDGITIGLYGANGQEIIGSSVINDIRSIKPEAGAGSGLYSGHVAVIREIRFGNDHLGTLWFTKPVRKSSDQILQQALKVTLGIQIGILLIIIIAGQQVISRLVLRPLDKLVVSIPRIARFVNGEDKELSIPKNLGSMELNNVSLAMQDMSVRVQTALQDQQKAVVESERQAAIAQTTQMLAHDVRKPFTMLQMALDSIESVKNDPEKVIQLAKELKYEASQSIASVNGLISDVLEVGNTSSPIVKSEQVPSLLKQALTEVFRYQKSCGIGFSYQLLHTKSVEVERLKCLRAFVNIIENARQATGSKGKMWFNTRDVEGPKGTYVEIVFGNSGQQIPEEVHEKLFEVFYTRGKRGGTGLGLAICRRVVKAHGGDIGCRNVGGGVEFWMQFPAGDRDLAGRPAFPAMSGEVCASAFKNENESQEQRFSQVLTEKRQLTIDALLAHREKSTEKINVLIFDDDISYGRSLAAHITGDREIAEFIDVTIELSSARVLDPCPDDKFDLIICDVDLGEDSLNGYEIVRRLRSCGAVAHICMHSNRSLPEDYKMALHAGADAFTPKPMSRVHLLDLLRKALVPVLKGAVLVAPMPATEKPLVVLIEDHIFMRESWQNTLEKDCVVMAFESPKGFEQALSRDASLISRIHCVVTDFYIEDTIDGGKDEETTLAFAKRFRGLKGRPPLILTTLGDLSPEILKHYDGAVAKGSGFGAIDSVLNKALTVATVAVSGSSKNL